MTPTQNTTRTDPGADHGDAGPAAPPAPGGRRRMPSIFVILGGVLLLCALATYVVPAGQYALTDAGTVEPGTYTSAPRNGVSFVGLFASLHTGMVESAGIIFGLLFTGGAFAVLERTGAVNGLLAAAVRKAGGNRYLLVVAVMLVFGAASVTGVITSEVIAFFPLGLLVARALGLDALTGLCMVFIPVSVGYATSVINPSSLALAQTISGLPLFSGKGYRFAVFCVLLVLAVGFVLRHARRVVRDRATTSPGAAQAGRVDAVDPTPFTWQHRVVMASFAVLLAGFVVGTSLWDWGLAEMAGTFVLISLVAAVVCRLRPDDFIESFVQGMSSLVLAALLIGIARSITVVLQDGMVMDTIVHALATVMAGLSPTGGAVSLLAASAGINFFVGSGTGQAALTIPIIAPLTDLLGLTRQLGIMCFQLGDGITNMVFPTSSVLVAGLAIAKVPFGRWLRFIAPFMLAFVVVAVAAVVVGHLISYS